MVDQWGLLNVRMRAAKPDELPTESLRFPRPGAQQKVEQPKKDRYQKSRERAAFFGVG